MFALRECSGQAVDDADEGEGIGDESNELYHEHHVLRLRVRQCPDQSTKSNDQSTKSKKVVVHSIVLLLRRIGICATQRRHQEITCKHAAEVRPHG
jgi:hypothetical protein